MTMKEESNYSYENKRLRIFIILHSITILSLIGSIICQILSL